MLTTNRMCGYSGDRAQNSIYNGYVTPVSGDFLYPIHFGGAENTTPAREIISRDYRHVLSPRSLAGLGNLSKKVYNMNNLVNISNNKAVTTSKIIADTFGKVHRDVVRAINNLDIPEDFRVRNFAQSKFKADNVNGLEYDCYEITRDGFTLLAMGFTGKKAMKFKIKYINAFNDMEAKLKSVYPCGEKSVIVSEHLRSLPVKKELTLSAKIRAELTELVNTQVEQTLRKVLADVFYPGINQHPSDMPFGNWAVSAVHAIGAMRSEYENLKDRQQEVIRLLEDKR